MTTKELENYVPKGQLEGFPKEIISRMLDCQEKQGNPRDVTVFERDRTAGQYVEGFAWYKTKEGNYLWHKIINNKNFDLFFEKYPKQDNQDNSQEFNLENYVPKGELAGFPKEIIARMLDCQEEQGNKRDVSVFEKNITTYYKGFTWNKTKEGYDFWFKVIKEKNFNVFFEKYPKKEDTSQEFKVGDKVYDILLKEIGVVQDIVHSSSIPYGLSVEFKSGIKSYTINGCYIPEYKNPHLLHYRNDYNYDIIDFNNLPQRQEVKRYRAEVGEKYYYLDIYFEVHSFLEEYSNTDTKLYKTGNYFQTKEKAQKIADQMNTYFQKIVKIDLENSNEIC